MLKDLTVIILSYNTKQVTKECLRRVYEAKRFSERTLNNRVKVIVVDNASQDSSTQMIRRKFPWVKLLAMKKNLGFSGGNNYAMRLAKTPFILLLNSDTFLEKETIAKALKFFESHRSCDVLSVALIYPDKGFQPSGGFLPTPFRTILWFLGLESIPFAKKVIQPIYIYERSFFGKERCLEWASGAFFLLRREVYKKTKGFDENFFMYLEDVEWCKRIKDWGLKIYYTPEITVVHLGGSSAPKLSRWKLLERQFQGLLYFHKIHYPKTYFLIKAFGVLGFFLRLIFFSFF